MKKKALAGGIAAALLGSGLLWYSGIGPDQGIAGWETLNDSMENVIHKSNKSTDAVASSTETGIVTRTAPPTAPRTAPPTTPPTTPPASEGMVNVNTATVDELMELPGIGAAKAQAILDYRKSQGPFKGLTDLGKVKAIGPKMLEKLKPLVSF
ncbi:MAG: ComEA family DNA-binding protein [Paenibacillus sp.]|nr:ComEA family DNA-binding protein [Paenibacillus sp.]